MRRIGGEAATPSLALLVAAFAMTLGLAAIVLGYFGFRGEAASDLEVLYEAPTFALTDHLERPMTSSELQGKVVIANFVYTSCPDICPLLSARMQVLQERLRAEGLLRDVRLLSFTVDPARDTPQVLASYASRYQPDPEVWRFLTGPKEDVEQLVVEGFRLGVQALPPEERDTSEHSEHERSEQAQYEVMHSARFVIIDREWRIRAYYDGSQLDIERVLRDARGLR